MYRALVHTCTAMLTVAGGRLACVGNIPLALALRRRKMTASGGLVYVGLIL